MSGDYPPKDVDAVVPRGRHLLPSPLPRLGNVHGPQLSRLVKYNALVLSVPTMNYTPHSASEENPAQKHS